LISNLILKQGETVLACRTVGPERKQRQVVYDGEGKTKLVPISHEITDSSSEIRTRTGSILWLMFYVPMLRI